MIARPPLPILKLLFLLSALSLARGADPADADSQPLAGVVVHASGRPAADVDVWLVTASLSGDVEVYDHVKSAADGTFRVTVPGRWINQTLSLRQELGVVAFRAGAAPAVVGFARSSPVGGSLQIELKPAAGSSLRVLAPDGRPVAGAKVTVASIACGAIRGDLAVDASTADRLGLTYATPEMQAALKATRNGPALGRIAILLPPEVSQSLRAETGGDGKVLLPGIAIDDIAAIKIESRDFGTQVAALQINLADFKHEPHMPDAIRLRPVGSLVGRLVAKAQAKQVKAAIKVRSFSSGGEQNQAGDMTVFGLAEVAADNDGRFEIPVIAEGAADFFVSLPKESPLRARLPANRGLKIQAGESAKVEIPLAPAIRATGLVRQRGTKQPIAGVVVQVLHGVNNQEATVTDGQGRYTCLVSSGEVLAVLLVPSAYAPLARDRLRLTTISETKTTFELPPMELTPLHVVRGAVADEDGRPVANASVQALWCTTDRRRHQQSLLSRQTTTDDKGCFAIAGIDADQELVIEARSPNAFGRLRTSPKNQQDEPVALTVRKENLVGLSGRVVDTSGKTMSGVLVEIWGWPHVPEGAVSTPERVKFAANIELRTDGEGRYQTPRELDRDSMYQARLALPDRAPAATPGLSAALQNKQEFDDLVVRRVTAIAGRVEDRQGRGVPDATVFQSGDVTRRLQTTTDAEGRFRLEGAMAAPTFVFVSQPGFRFFGQLLDGHEDAVVLAITRPEETADAWHTLPPVTPKDERLALARRVLRPCLEKVDAENEDRAVQTLVAYGHVDPAGLLSRLEEKPPKDPFFSGFVRRAAAKALAADDVGEALAVVETIDEASFRSMCYLDIVDTLGQDQRSRKLELLAQATVVARSVGNPDMRVLQLGETADRLLDLGERDQAVALLREGEKLARELPLEAFGGYARGAFAEELGRIDLPAALELMKGLKDVYEFDRHHGNLAHELAATEPVEAERLLGMLHEAKESKLIVPPHDEWGLRVCYRMAPADLPRARRIAACMTNRYLQAQTYGVMAQAIGKSEPEAAKELIERAFDVLQRLVEARETAQPDGESSPAAQDSYNGLFSASSVAGSLLPAVEAVDATLVPEYFWRAVSFRLPGVGDDSQQNNAKRSNAGLSMMLARYHRDIAEGVFRLSHVYGGRRDTGLTALALIDPARAAAVVEADPTDDNSARVQLAELLAIEGDALGRKLNGSLGLWSIDVEDIIEY